MKVASLWDMPRPTLDAAVWEKSGKLKPEHRQFILDFVKKHLETEGFTAYDTWVIDIALLGSLASYQYNSRSDADVHLVVDLQQFSQLEYNGGLTVDQAHDVLEAVHDKINEAAENLPGTEHPTEVTFHYRDWDKGFIRGVLPSNVGVYDLIKGRWVSEPKGKDLSPVAAEKLYPELLGAVMDMAHRYDVQLGQMRKDVVDVEYLRESMAQFPSKYRPILEAEIQGKIDQINAEIEQYVADTKHITDKRKSGPYPVMPAELQMKYLSRYGYLWLYKQFKEMEKQVEEPDLADLSQKLKEVPKLV